MAMNTTAKNVIIFDAAKHAMYGNTFRLKGLNTL